VVQLANNTGSVTKEYAYDAFGNEKNIDSNDSNPYRYCGEYYDKETGSIYLRARYYKPEYGRFLTEDCYPGKANNSLSLNLYTYCENDSVNFIDPSGLLKQNEQLKRYGSNNKDDVIELQKKLSSLGYYAGRFDGSFGPQTLAAVNAYKDKYLKGGNTGANRGAVGATTWTSPGLALVEARTVVAPKGLPRDGEPPNSKGYVLNPNGNVKQVREYDSDGRAFKDNDYNHGGNGKEEFPHEHYWDWDDEEDPRQPSQPIKQNPDRFNRERAVQMYIMNSSEYTNQMQPTPIILPILVPVLP
jgi:RHS repeat-associated protein